MDARRVFALILPYYAQWAPTSYHSDIEQASPFAGSAQKTYGLCPMQGQLSRKDDRGRDNPTIISSLMDKDIVHAAASDFHTAFLTSEGELYMTGNNDSGQLGARLRESQLSFVQVSSLDTYHILHVACGQAHSIDVAYVRALVSWGATNLSQLGHKDVVGVVDVIQPHIIKGTREIHFVHVACGVSHTPTLSGSGEVYSFGQGIFGALGSSNMENNNTPIGIEELWGLGIIQIACGENHIVSLSVDGNPLRKKTQLFL